MSRARGRKAKRGEKKWGEAFSKNAHNTKLVPTHTHTHTDTHMHSRSGSPPFFFILPLCASFSSAPILFQSSFTCFLPPTSLPIYFPSPPLYPHTTSTFGFPTVHTLSLRSSPPVASNVPVFFPNATQFTGSPCAINSSEKRGR